MNARCPAPLSADERIHYRDRLRSARYAALADAEGFQQTCYALEALGMRLLGREAALDAYRVHIKDIAVSTPSLSLLADEFPMFFTRFDALYDVVRRARNDAMHGGSYARHATDAAVELCIGLEEAVMLGAERITKVSDYMVKTPFIAEPWHLVAHVRHLILKHSFSFLPVFHEDKWSLVSEMSLVMYLRSLSAADRRLALAQQLSCAISNGLKLVEPKKIKSDDDIATVLADPRIGANPVLWLVVDDQKKLVGVLSPFELM